VSSRRQGALRGTGALLCSHSFNAASMQLQCSSNAAAAAQYPCGIGNLWPAFNLRLQPNDELSKVHLRETSSGQQLALGERPISGKRFSQFALLLSLSFAFPASLPAISRAFSRTTKAALSCDQTKLKKRPERKTVARFSPIQVPFVAQFELACMGGSFSLFAGA